MGTSGAVATARARFEALQTFEAATAFDLWAGEQIEAIARDAAALVEQRDRMNKEAAAEAARIASLNWFARLFASKKQLAALRANAEDVDQKLASKAGQQDELGELIEYTPNDTAEQRLLLKELRLQKKELQLRKKEIGSEMRAIRQGHRVASADAGRFLGGLLYDRKIAAATRREMRVRREAQLGPHESEKEAIERQLRTLERRIIWTERFGSEPGASVDK